MFSRQKGRILLPSFRNLSEHFTISGICFQGRRGVFCSQVLGISLKIGQKPPKRAPARTTVSRKCAHLAGEASFPAYALKSSSRAGNLRQGIRPLTAPYTTLKAHPGRGTCGRGCAPVHCSAYALKSSSQAGNLRRSEMGLPLWSIKQWALLPLARRVPAAASRISYSSSNFTPV